ncbi:sugar phosphate nucleotidyltransferase [Bradyrhizobium sp. ARR65]|uniref:sugar phosphate nucleotidyltransferase n=1 Tax=Bradyrhizobium sp. ARR65 TaxID=1040989 RepID=UPI000463EDCA|nr:sugar phosphate nucleotidyltransferase [Bradyrhizobium sp. ARR65]
MDNATQSVILAAGMGSRLRPYAETIPKPLVKVSGIPILHNALHQLSELGIREATIVVGYRKDSVEQSCDARFNGREFTADEVAKALLMDAGVAKVSGRAFGDPPVSASPRHRSRIARQRLTV